MDQHRFNPDNKDALESAVRKKLMPPDKLLGLLPIQKNHQILDLGAGTGYFSIPAAHMTNGLV
ncbi:hypothetical protein N6H14_21250 [Paenibacillus sp. CC-CFT747]|nr:hypothetical protein N6H14_21250 [Paenibacillus sp. CC-CFT747]